MTGHFYLFLLEFNCDFGKQSQRQFCYRRFYYFSLNKAFLILRLKIPQKVGGGGAPGIVWG
jgi:hypothetical protein